MNSAQNPSPSLSPVGSSLLRREPAVESIARYGVRAFRIPTAAKALACISKAALPNLRAATIEAVRRCWVASFHRVGGGLRPADLSHHRTYRSVYGGSLVFAFLLMQVCDDVVVFSNPHMDGHSGISLLFRSCFLPVVFFLKLSAFKPMVGYFH